ncbi:MAG: hypothetical protein H6Q19_335 [Bacteroidetes bacterium]|nr:hypothetical protein [Bacteroidota bacterium]
MKKNIYIFLRKLAKKILTFPYSICITFICKIRSNYYTNKIDDGGGKIIISDTFMNFKIKKHPTARLIIKGNLRTIAHVGNKNPIYIELGENSTLSIEGDFTIGRGVRITLNTNSVLIIGGKEKESDSGITADTLIMVYKKISLGKDFMCAWNVFISDSDWHHIEGQNHHSDIIIGDHVWIANSNNILKGSVIGNNTIVASNSKTINSAYPDNVLIGGVPAKILREKIGWSRDL